MNQVLTRDMEERDVPSVALIERISFSAPWSETSFFNELFKARSLAKVAELDDRIIGYICAESVLEEAHILTLAVHPGFRQSGIASLLVKQAAEELKSRGCRFLFLEVRASNHAAQRLYETFHFKLVGIRKKYYLSPPEDAIIMKLDL